ncbi:siphovirus Gp157 family protein [Rhodobacter sp. NTK016B]|uniref:siphovirus Gp157 family protein n=1 Tax=Rhodobacter sp. NTK016B TaxID=2759676 RepID=UPI001A901B8F|nr:siphovirus Gp157 family protein [Rhodobacter sp. NTK016B]MBN8292857.1 siphovirus Gp157 family protein [Rhodobacter sp. NTK016B]
MSYRIDLPLIERIAAELAPYRDDEDVFLDTLDGETDALTILDREIEAEQADLTMAEAIETRIATLKARADRVKMRAAAHRTAQKLVMEAIGQKKVERPLATLSLLAGSISVKITNEADIPSQLCTVKAITTPDKKAIRAQIEAGEAVPGAELVRGEETLSVRTK